MPTRFNPPSKGISDLFKGSSELRLDRLLEFKGWGNPAGPFWFLGIEEYGPRDPKEMALNIRRRLTFGPIEDLVRVHATPPLGPITGLIPTWATMSKIVLRLKHDPMWQDRGTVFRYQSRHLGTSDGETFLTELLPLPKPSDDYWPDWWPWHSWDKYAMDVMPRRIDALRALFKLNKPKFLFCYGKGYWSWHQEIFPSANFLPILDSSMRMAQVDDSRIVLTPFFAFFLMPNGRIESMVQEIERTL